MVLIVCYLKTGWWNLNYKTNSMSCSLKKCSYTYSPWIRAGPACSAYVCLLLLIRWNTPFKTAGRVVSLGKCVYDRQKVQRERGTVARDNDTTCIFQRSKMCRFHASEKLAAKRREEKSWSITAILDKGTPPFPLSRPGMYGCVNPRLCRLSLSEMIYCSFKKNLCSLPWRITQ